MIRPITITAVMNGFVVTVGCQTVVFNDVQTLCGQLANYLTHPEQTEQQFSMHPNAKHTMNNGPATPVYIGSAGASHNVVESEPEYRARRQREVDASARADVPSTQYDPNARIPQTRPNY